VANAGASNRCDIGFGKATVVKKREVRQQGVSMSGQQRHWLITSSILIIVLLPLTFNPFMADPFEPGKALLLQSVLLGMLAIFVGSFFLVRDQNGRLRFNRPFQQIHLTKTNWQPGYYLRITVVAYAFIYILATVTSIDSQTSWWGRGDRHGTLLTLSAILFFFLLTAALNEWSQIERIISAMILGSVAVTFYGWIQYLGLDMLAWHSSSISPVHSTLGRSIFLGAYLAMIIPFVLARLIVFWQQHCPIQFLAYLLILFLLVGCLFFTLARGAWLGLIGGLLLFTALLIPPRQTSYLGLLILFVAGLAIFFFIRELGWVIFSSDAINQPIENLSRWRDGSDQARLVTWQEALTLIPDRWLLGYGPETYAIASQQKRYVLQIEQVDWLHMSDPHNLFLYQLTAVGVTGFLLFLGIILQFYRGLLAALKRQPGIREKTTISAIIGSMTAYFIQAQFNPDMITLVLLCWLNLSLGYTIRYKLSPSYH
jgi:O-antigen ligase